MASRLLKYAYHCRIEREVLFDDGIKVLDGASELKVVCNPTEENWDIVIPLIRAHAKMIPSKKSLWKIFFVEPITNAGDKNWEVISVDAYIDRRSEYDDGREESDSRLLRVINRRGCQIEEEWVY